MALISVMVVLCLIASLVAVVALSVNGNLRNNQVADLKKEARYCAYAGAQRALLDIKNNPSNTSAQWPTPLYNQVSMPYDPDSNYTVNVTSNLNFNPVAPTILYAPDNTAVPPGLVYIQAVGTSHYMALTGDSVLATMGRTGTVNWDRAARLTNLIYSEDSWVEIINLTTGAIGPAVTNTLVTVVDNQVNSVNMVSASDIAGNLEIPYQAAAATAVHNVSTLPAWNPPGPPDNSFPRNSVPKFGTDSSLSTNPGWFAPPFPSVTSAPSSLSPGSSYDHIDINTGSGPPYPVLTVPAGAYYIKHDLKLNGVNVTVTGGNAIVYVAGDAVFANTTVNWAPAPPQLSPLQCQFVFPYNHGSSNRIFYAYNSTMSTVIGGKQVNIGLNNTQMVGAVMANELYLYPTSKLDYPITPLWTSPVQSTMLVDIAGQKSDRSVGSGFTFTCFVATAAYGDINAPEVVELRKFRDNVLLQSAAGRWLVGLYYRTSPPLANLIARSEPLRFLARAVLAPIVLVVSNFQIACLLLTFLIALVLLTWRLWVKLAYYGLTGRTLAPSLT